MWWPSSPLIIDDATLDDADELSAVHATGFDPMWSGGEIAGLLRDETVFGIVARRGSPFGSRRPVGFVLVRMAADEAEILTIAVRPSHRKRGVGRSLLEAALRRLYHDRIAALFLEVDAGNAGAVSLYRKLGFRQVGERTGYYRTGNGERSTALVMRRDLR
ncbi:MAG: ribosomal-protein-alanine N-acetyltransferase [Hyphomicrobiales bacterium]|nr:MAG: ribosomal-protein-alanine N-acetyltransferase [Hyphomicrobiales bacterium]